MGSETERRVFSETHMRAKSRRSKVAKCKSVKKLAKSNEVFLSAADAKIAIKLLVTIILSSSRC